MGKAQLKRISLCDIACIESMLWHRRTKKNVVAKWILKQANSRPTANFHASANQRNFHTEIDAKPAPFTCSSRAHDNSRRWIIGIFLSLTLSAKHLLPKMLMERGETQMAKRKTAKRIDANWRQHVLTLGVISRFFENWAPKILQSQHLVHGAP